MAVVPATTGHLGALAQAIVDHMQSELPSDVPVEHEFRALHGTYATWRLRRPATAPRTAHLSRELQGNALWQQYAAQIQQVGSEIESGADIGPRLSRAVKFAHPSKKKKSRHLDRLLADWGLYHLHLGSTVESDGFVKRSRHVLIVSFKPEDAYLVDLVDHEPHDNWSSLHLLEVVVRNWPDAGIVIASVTGSRIKGGNQSDEDRRSLRNAGIATGGVEIDGKVWSAASIGQSLSGQPFWVGQLSMNLLSWLSGFDDAEAKLTAELSRLAKEHEVPDEWAPWVIGEDYGFHSGGKGIVFGSLVPRR